jgi:hypothetical protein
MSDVIVFLWIVAGIGLSIAVPVAVRTLRPPDPSLEGIADSWFIRVLRPYLKYAIASIVLGFLTLAVIKYNGGQIDTWPKALMAGYLWDATIQKIKEGFGPSTG